MDWWLIFTTEIHRVEHKGHRDIFMQYAKAILIHLCATSDNAVVNRLKTI